VQQRTAVPERKKPFWNEQFREKNGKTVSEQTKLLRNELKLFSDRTSLALKS